MVTLHNRCSDNRVLVVLGMVARLLALSVFRAGYVVYIPTKEAYTHLCNRLWYPSVPSSPSLSGIVIVRGLDPLSCSSGDWVTISGEPFEGSP